MRFNLLSDTRLSLVLNEAEQIWYYYVDKHRKDNVYNITLSYITNVHAKCFIGAKGKALILSTPIG